jgi:hypothetical protein
MRSRRSRRFGSVAAAIELSLGDEDTAKLRSIAQSRTEPARVERARILLAYRVGSVKTLPAAYVQAGRPASKRRCSRIETRIRQVSSMYLHNEGSGSHENGRLGAAASKEIGAESGAGSLAREKRDHFLWLHEPSDD